jgi:hypothetical protein
MAVHGKYGYNDLEMMLMLIVTAVTNLAMIPVIRLFYKKKGSTFLIWLGFFTMLTSLMYHLCESLDTRFILTEL